MSDKSRSRESTPTLLVPLPHYSRTVTVSCLSSSQPLGKLHAKQWEEPRNRRAFGRDRRCASPGGGPGGLRKRKVRKTGLGPRRWNAISLQCGPFQGYQAQPLPCPQTPQALSPLDDPLDRSTSSRGACRARKALRLRLSTPHSIRVVHGKRIVSSYREVQSRLSDVREDRVVIYSQARMSTDSKNIRKQNCEYT